MPPRRFHRMNLDKYQFMQHFLENEWTLCEEERGNYDTSANASLDVVYESFRNFIDMHGYSESYCNKILLGKLLHDAGIEKVKRGPRKRQKFYYMPIKPCKGSYAERIFDCTESARYVVGWTEAKSKGIVGLDTKQLRGLKVEVISPEKLHDQKDVYQCEAMKKSSLSEVIERISTGGYRQESWVDRQEDPFPLIKPNQVCGLSMPVISPDMDLDSKLQLDLNNNVSSSAFEGDNSLPLSRFEIPNANQETTLCTQTLASSLNPPRRLRGRPKGSKNKKKSPNVGSSSLHVDQNSSPYSYHHMYNGCHESKAQVPKFDLFRSTS